MKSSPKVLLTSALSLAAATLLAGCGMSSVTPSTVIPVTPAAKLSGSLHGGQQAIVGSTINMYAASLTGYASTASSILKPGVTVTTDGSGGFGLTGAYTCPSASSLIYITAMGGNAGSGPNSGIGLMAALGPCGNLTNSTFIYINEVSTVAAAFPLAPFATGPTAIGTSPTNYTGLLNAFNDVNLLATLGTGTSPGTVPTGATMPTSTINSIANLLAACVNSSGGTSPACATLYANATPGPAISDTLTAAINIAKYPGNNVATLYSLGTPAAPFQPALTTQPSDFTLAGNFLIGQNGVTGVANDAAGNAWVTDGLTITLLNPQGTKVFTDVVAGSAVTAIAVDPSGNGWAIGKGNSALYKVTPTGSMTTFTGNGLNTPTALAIDGQGQVWVTNTSTTPNGIISAFSGAGVALPGSPYSTTGVSPNDIAFNAH